MWRSIRALQAVATGGSQPVDMTQLPRRALGYGRASVMERAGGEWAWDLAARDDSKRT